MGADDEEPTATSREDPIAELAASLDHDAERIFRFVADEVRYEPYAGILRGARGALASRAGNSADQALLLGALLEASLLPHRFAIGAIDDASAEALLEGAETDAETIRRQGLEGLTRSVPGREPIVPELTPELRAEADRALGAAEEVVSWARDQLEGTVGMIGSALDAAGVRLPEGFTALPALERERHVWVQLAASADWIDLDPTIPGSTPGATLGSASEVVDSLPEEMAHHIELAVIAEDLSGDRLEERTLLRVADRADAIAGKPIAIRNTRPEGMAGIASSIAGAFVGGTSYVPAIAIGDEVWVGSSVMRFPDGGPGEGGGGLGDVLGGGFLDGDDGPEDQVTAEWVEVTILSPGQEPLVVRRDIFDRIGPARRGSGQLEAGDLAPVDRVDMGEGLDDEILPALTAHWLTIATGMPSRSDATGP